jgi:ATP-dependent exoDNAse (exonuclease V) alpha subunit
VRRVFSWRDVCFSRLLMTNSATKFRNEHAGEWSKCQLLAWDILCPLFEDEAVSRVGVLRGFAGTGKTFWVAQVIRWLESEGWVVKVMTPTGRAAQVLNDRLVPYRVRAQVRTIHSAIYEVEPEDFSTNQLNLFAKTRTIQEEFPTVYVVDEASMVGGIKSTQEATGVKFGSGSILHDLIEASCVASRSDVRMLWIGDPAQLPPVSMFNQIAPALDTTQLRKVLDEGGYVGDVLEAELRTVVRQKEGPLVEFISQIRTALELGEQLPKKGNNEVRRLDRDLFVTEYLKRTAFGRQPENAVVLAHSNVAVSAINTSIRNALGRTGVGLAEGELLLIKRNSVLSDFGDLEISGGKRALRNGTFVVVHSEPRMLPKRMVRLNREEINLEFWAVRIKPVGTSDILDVVILKNYLDSDLNGGNSRKRSELYSKLDTALLVDFQLRMREKRNLKPAKPGDEHYERYRTHARSDPFLNALRVQYGYCVTVHNAQGGEWDTVFVDPASNHEREWQASPKHLYSFTRWVYTASTRAKRDLWFIGAERLLAVDAEPQE